MDNESKDFEMSDLESIIQILSDEKIFLNNCSNIFRESYFDIVFKGNYNYEIATLYSELNTCHIIAYVINNDDFNNTLQKIHIGLDIAYMIATEKLNSEYIDDNNLRKIIILYCNTLFGISNNIYHLVDILLENIADEGDYEFTISIPQDINDILISSCMPDNNIIGVDMTIDMSKLCDRLSKTMNDICTKIEESLSKFKETISSIKNTLDSSENDEEDK